MVVGSQGVMILGILFLPERSCYNPPRRGRGAGCEAESSRARHSRRTAAGGRESGDFSLSREFSDAIRAARRVYDLKRRLMCSSTNRSEGLGVIY